MQLSGTHPPQKLNECIPRVYALLTKKCPGKELALLSASKMYYDV